MGFLRQYWVLIAGVLSPFAAAVLDELAGRTVERVSHDPKQWFFRLSCVAVAITFPFFVTLYLALRERRNAHYPRRSKVALGFAALSLGVVALPVQSGIMRWRQSRNEALQGVPAPFFATTDIFGNSQRLADQRNKVVLVNIWATWCGPCRAEMPKLDELYKTRKSRGLMVFGISNEDAGSQRDFLNEIPVSYPLLTVDGQVPSLYRDISRYPGMFLIDRQGRLQRAPGPEEPFEKLEAVVDKLLSEEEFGQR
jgi:cytochrome c biogenesis protein CcmG, thiol:disulfide interchange protein DsbE